MSRSLMRAVATLVLGSALGQIVPLLLGPLLTRLYTPSAIGVWTTFTVVAAMASVAACARYEFALPMASDAEAITLLKLCSRILLAVSFISLPIGLVWAHWRNFHEGYWLGAAVASSGLLQLVTLWSNRFHYFRSLAISRVVQYGAAAVIQVALGAVFWLHAQRMADAAEAWLLIIGPILATLLAALCLLKPAWRAWRQPSTLSLKSVAVRYRDFPLLNTPHAFLGALQDTLAVALVVAFSGQAAAGFWGLSLRYLKAPSALVGGAVSQALYPRLRNTPHVQARRAVRQVMVALSLIGLAWMLFLLIAGPWLFQTLFGQGWTQAGELARALSPYIAGNFIASPLSVATMAWQAQRWAFRYAIIGQIAFVGALWLGLRLGGLIVGAWAVSAAMSIYFAYYFYRLAVWPDQPTPAFRATRS